MGHKMSPRATLAVTVSLLLFAVYVLMAQFLSDTSLFVHVFAPGYQWGQSVREKWGNASSPAKGDNASPRAKWGTSSSAAKWMKSSFPAKWANTSSAAKWVNTSSPAKWVNTSSPAKWNNTSFPAKWMKSSSAAKERDYASPQAKHLSRTSSQATLPKSLTFIADSNLQSRKVSITSSRELKTIYFFNRPGWFYPNNPNLFRECDVNACVLTHNEPERADAVVFHMCANLQSPLPFKPAQYQVWIAFGLESPPHCRYYRNPYSRSRKFNWTMTYRTDSDVFAPYGLLRLRETPSEKNYTAIVSGKSKPVAWFVSNCNDRSKRQKYVKELSKHIQVDIYGHCGTLTCPRSSETDCMRLLNTTYFFYLSFENSLCRDYMTEKVFKLYDNVNVIPVVRGQVDYDRYLPPGTFLNTADFPTPRALALRLRALMADTTEFADMLRLKDRFSQNHCLSFCKLCQKLHEDNGAKTYPDLSKWASEGICRDAVDV
ncbi:3-galactosyl-N-acetylglucosaminide 4-alpha-L-fucosyltransferase FUT3-like [Littorina saxatilis]|uniref:3-galactosyl-N-acetylglucosaminide 4-alpha-L-fucosyltransferase FUT3-like n=1 Tax=Littorina saxatilis TaxID=31220 RepID=UPI0038B5C30E